MTSDAIYGGMGSVWRVHHQSWNTDLAMKRPQPRFFAKSGDARKKQFIEECEHWINLGLHPNIVSCYYVREIGGVPTIFSEWMDGGSLKGRITDGLLYQGSESEIQERILDIAIQAARGLQYSHDNLLIHQDMKPGNLLLSKDWDAKVADFGLAKAKEQLDSKSEAAKTTGYTLAYCPKEQSDGEEPQRWMDVYAWALTVLEMYAGKRLWNTGAEAKYHFDEYLSQCAHTVPDGMTDLLRSCMRDKQDGFADIKDRLISLYCGMTGAEYPRSYAEISDTAGALNNRALSFLDLGRCEEAKTLWEKGIELDNSYFLCHYNLAVALWNEGEILAPELYERIHSRPEDTELWRRADASVSFAVPKTFYEVYPETEEARFITDVFPDYKIYRDNNKTLSPDGKIQVYAYKDVYFFNPEKPKRNLMHIPPLLDFEEGTERYSSVGSFDNYGFVSIQPQNIRYKLPPADPQVDYILSKVESIQNRLDAIKRLDTVLPDAKNAYENGDYQTVFSLLSPLMDDGTLLRSDEAVLLWEKLYPYFHPLKLVNVIPDEHFSGEAFITYKDLIIPNTPPDEKTEEVDVTSDGVTRVYSKEEDYFWRENYSGGIDWEFHFSMRAEDIRSGKEWYSSKSFFDSYETEDYTPMDHGLYMKLRHNFIWFWRLRTAGRYNLGDPDVQRKIDLRFMLRGQVHILFVTRKTVCISGIFSLMMNTKDLNR